MQYHTSSSTKKYRFGLYECPNCNVVIRCMVADVKSNKSTKCAACAIKDRATKKIAKSAEGFIEACCRVHGNTYDYTGIIYTSALDKVGIGCKKHGLFWQVAQYHKNGHGCPKCAKENSNIATRMFSSRPTSLYYVYLPKHSLWKIGCTSRTVEARFAGIEFELLDTVMFAIGADAYRLEHLILTKLESLKYTGERILRGGNTEILVEPIDFALELGIAYTTKLQIELDKDAD